VGGGGVESGTGGRPRTSCSVHLKDQGNSKKIKQKELQCRPRRQSPAQTQKQKRVESQRGSLAAGEGRGGKQSRHKWWPVSQGGKKRWAGRATAQIGDGDNGKKITRGKQLGAVD